MLLSMPFVISWMGERVREGAMRIERERERRREASHSQSVSLELERGAKERRGEKRAGVASAATSTAVGVSANQSAVRAQCLDRSARSLAALRDHVTMQRNRSSFLVAYILFRSGFIKFGGLSG